MDTFHLGNEFEKHKAVTPVRDFFGKYIAIY